jgi:hypothetical protein
MFDYESEKEVTGKYAAELFAPLKRAADSLIER